MKERGWLVKREHYRHAVGTCERCHTRIEPLISRAVVVPDGGAPRGRRSALRRATVRYHPESQHRFAIASLEETPTGASRGSSGGAIRSRSGRRPTARTICAPTEDEAQAPAGEGVPLTRDPDVLDTWFSSALWPYATLGWPDETPELDRYYPGKVNSTAREIIRLWENRMIWTGLEALGEVPFTDVIIHSTGARPRRAADVEEPRHGDRPARDDRRARCRRDARTGS